MTDSTNGFCAGATITDHRKLECERGCVGGVPMATVRAGRPVAQRPHCESVWKRKMVRSGLVLPSVVWQPLSWRQGSVQAP